MVVLNVAVAKTHKGFNGINLIGTPSISEAKINI